MKKTIAMILSFTILFCLCACNNDGSQIPDSSNSSQAATNSTESSKGSTEMTTDGTEGTTAPAKDEAIREIVLPASSSKLGEDLDYKSSDTACYINVDGVSNKPKVESWDNAIVVDGVADYLDYLETLGFTVEIINTTTKEPYSGFYTHETNFKVSNEHISWTMYLFIQDEKYVEYQFDINLVISSTTEESTSVPTEGSNTVTTETPTAPSTQPPATEPPTTESSVTEHPASSKENSFDHLVSKYSGRWYLEGYFDVYIDIYLESDGDHSRNDTLCISAHNFAVPDSNDDDGLIYPDLQNIDGYCSGFGIIRNDYDSNNLTNYKRNHKISFNAGYICLGSHKFVTTQGSIARAAGITLNKTSLELFVGESEALIATIFPEGAINKEVTWFSSASSYATVSADGMVTGIAASAPGCVEITAITEDGQYVATCNVTVKEKVEAEPPATEPPATEPPATEPPATEPPTTEPSSDVLIISNAQTISNQTINTDVYITSTGVVTFKNVTVNGNVYCYGKLTVSGGSANNLYAYYWDLGGIVSSCDAWDGTHGLVKGAFSSCGNVIIKDNALDYAFNKWGKK